MSISCARSLPTPSRARGFIVPSATAPGNPSENTLLADTVAELQKLDITLREVALDGGFMPTPTNDALAPLQAERVYISGRQEQGSRRTRRRLQRSRTGADGRISHLKRGYGLRRSRLKGDEGHQIWDGWATFTYNTDTYTTLA